MCFYIGKQVFRAPFVEMPRWRRGAKAARKKGQAASFILNPPVRFVGSVLAHFAVVRMPEGAGPPGDLSQTSDLDGFLSSWHALARTIEVFLEFFLTDEQR